MCIDASQEFIFITSCVAVAIAIPFVYHANEALHEPKTIQNICGEIKLRGSSLLHLVVVNSELSDNIFQDVGSHCMNLQTLDVSGANIFIHYDKCRTYDLTPIAEGCRELRCLRLHAVIPAGDSLCAVMRNCSHLQELCSGLYCVVLDDALFKAMVEGNVRLRKLQATWAGISAETLYVHRNVLSALREVRLMLNNQAYQNLPEALACMQKLKSIEFWPAKAHDLSPRVELSFLRTIAYCCPSLVSITSLLSTALTSSQTGQKFALVAKDCRTLQCLHLQQGPFIPDSVLHAIGENCPDFRVLRCITAGVSDAGVVGLAAGCTHLTALGLCQASALTDATLLALQRCTDLREFALEDSYLLSNAAIIAIAEQCKKLTHVSVCAQNSRREGRDRGEIEVTLRRGVLFYMPHSVAAVSARVEEVVPVPPDAADPQQDSRERSGNGIGVGCDCTVV
jgi:hypothetical protein